MALDIIVNKAKEDPNFREQFLNEINNNTYKENEEPRVNFHKVREYLRKEFKLKNEEIIDQDIMDAWNNIIDFTRTEERNQDRSFKSPTTLDDVLNDMLFKDLEQEYSRTQFLKNALSNGLTDELKDIKRSRNRIMNMYTIAFIIGVCMISVAIISAFIPQYRDLNLIALFSGLGAVNVVSSLIFRPAKELQNMIIRSVELIGSFFTLVNDFQIWNTYIKYGSTKSLDDIKTISNLKISHLREIMLLINKLLDENVDGAAQGTDSNKK